MPNVCRTGSEDCFGHRFFFQTVGVNSDSLGFKEQTTSGLTNYTRGTPGETPASSESWSLDAQGNWTSNTTNGTEIDRTNNAQNQAHIVGGTTLAYDANGNLTSDQSGAT